MTHRHTYGWKTEPQGLSWVVYADCECGEVLWSCTAVSRDDLNQTLRKAFFLGRLPPLAYFTAPTGVPDVVGAVA